ncbi:unnamed protein product [Merluccius merluccius]
MFPASVPGTAFNSLKIITCSVFKLPSQEVAAAAVVVAAAVVAAAVAVHCGPPRPSRDSVPSPHTAGFTAGLCGLDL